MKGDTVMAFALDTEIEKVYDEYADQLYRIALSHSGNKEDAMDAVQDVFVKYASINKIFLDEEHRKAWFIRVTVNRCRDLNRKGKVRHYTPLEEVYDVPDKENDLPLRVKEMLEDMPEKFKAVLILHYLEGFSVEETSEILKLSLSAVKMRLSRARDYVKEKHKKEDFYV